MQKSETLAGKRTIVSQGLLFKLQYIGQICTIPKHIKKEIERI